MGDERHTSADDDDRRLTDAEALMWHIERDPWLAPSGGSITVFDRPLDVVRFRRLMTHAVATVPRLRQKVVDPATPLGTPSWQDDRELDLDWHVRRIGAPGAGTLRDVLDWTTSWLQDPYDRTRPLWQYVVVDHLADGRGALAMKLHHVVTDGKGAVRLGGAYTALERDAEDPPAVDLDALLASLPEEPAGMRAQVQGTIGEVVRAPAGAARALVDALTHPQRLTGARGQLDDLARTAAEQRHGAGAPLWTGRSRRRHLEALSVPFDDAHDAAQALGGSVNDFFVTGAVDAAARYHEVHGRALEHLHISFVVSTRSASTGTHNAFTPVPVDVPAGPMGVSERFAALRDVLHRRRSEVHGPGAMANVAVLANLLPTSVVTGVARAQAAQIDLATSNLPGYLGESFVAGAKAEHTYIFGPVAGTACNLTAYSTAGMLDIGLNVDPAAVTDPPLLRTCLEAAYADLVAVARPRRGKSR